MSDYWQNVKKNLQDGIRTVSEKTEELSKIGRLKIQIIAVKRDIEKNFTDLGGRVYEILNSKSKTDIEKDAEIVGIVVATKDLEKKLKQLEENVELIQSLRREKKSGDS